MSDLALSVRINLFVAGKVTSPMNRRTHWTERSLWASEWRQRVRLIWLERGRPMWDGPAHFQFTAYVAKLYDSDNLPPALKPIRDEAVACICGTDDGPRSGHRFSYCQEIKPHYRGVLITVTDRGD